MKRIEKERNRSKIFGRDNKKLCKMYECVKIYEMRLIWKMCQTIALKMNITFNWKDGNQNNSFEIRCIGWKKFSTKFMNRKKRIINQIIWFMVKDLGINNLVLVIYQILNLINTCGTYVSLETTDWWIKSKNLKSIEQLEKYHAIILKVQDRFQTVDYLFTSNNLRSK